ncbi:hypothetical protein DL766_005370 [Monosporascus sp. MC13-8B]|uniref:Uncharacterized protein n=1 Tax=Monosporascus cannonballus TaxID=155416 RepID=A0ABY0HH37_9PEZI|nr:hypothetical protein DL762_001328 [Monosporascus cannonballus]RYP00375.1 hypothetical protein DL763_000841 [Monosporascus cannonballus]RYP29475.1 hypothetical protein DL766_005370 [Monosporascus sp. MC13-8B]
MDHRLLPGGQAFEAVDGAWLPVAKAVLDVTLHAHVDGAICDSVLASQGEENSGPEQPSQGRRKLSVKARRRQENQEAVDTQTTMSKEITGHTVRKAASEA